MVNGCFPRGSGGVVGSAIDRAGKVKEGVDDQPDITAIDRIYDLHRQQRLRTQHPAEPIGSKASRILASSATASRADASLNLSPLAEISPDEWWAPLPGNHPTTEPARAKPTAAVSPPSFRYHKT